MRGFDIDEYSRVEFSGKSELSAKITLSNQAEMYKRYTVSVLCIKRLFQWGWQVGMATLDHCCCTFSNDNLHCYLCEVDDNRVSKTANRAPRTSTTA